LNNAAVKIRGRKIRGRTEVPPEANARIVRQAMAGLDDVYSLVTIVMAKIKSRPSRVSPTNRFAA
jgi:hypothetical protein